MLGIFQDEIVYHLRFCACVPHRHEELCARGQAMPPVIRAARYAITWCYRKKILEIHTMIICVGIRK